MSFIALTIVGFVFFAMISLCILAQDENYDKNYYICDECHDITSHKKTVIEVYCPDCNKMKRKLKNH